MFERAISTTMKNEKCLKQSFSVKPGFPPHKSKTTAAVQVLFSKLRPGHFRYYSIVTDEKYPFRLKLRMKSILLDYSYG